MGIRLEGVASTQQILRTFSKRTRGTVMRRAGEAAGRVIRDEIRNAVPRLNGYLRKSIKHKVKQYDNVTWSAAGQDMSLIRRAGTKSKKRNRGGGISGTGNTVPSHLVNNPTKAHRIAAGARMTGAGKFRLGVLRWSQGRRRELFRQTVRHPGTAGAAYMLRAQLYSKRKASKAFEQRMRQEVNKRV